MADDANPGRAPGDGGWPPPPRPFVPAALPTSSAPPPGSPPRAQASHSTPAPSPQAGTACVARAATATPLSALELHRSLARPDLLASHVLGSPDRIAQNVARGEATWLLVGALAVASVLAAAPYGAFWAPGRFWTVAALFTGSMLICLPCLHVFLQFLGFRITFAQNLSLALVIAATAGLFTFGFFPIVWFIRFTTASEGDAASVTPEGLARFLLGVSLAMGLVQMCRCLASNRRAVCERGGVWAPVLLWIPLLVFIVWRMAGVLGLRG